MNQKGFANVVLIVVIVVVLAVGGYFVFSKKSATPTETQQTQTSNNNGQGGNQINIPSDGIVVDTKGLSLHKSESCGFEISFPSQFVNKKTKQCSKYPIPEEIDMSNYQNEPNKSEFVSCGGFPVDYPGYSNGLITPCSYYYKKIEQYEIPVRALTLTSKADCQADDSNRYPAGCQLFSIEVTNGKVVGGVTQNIMVDNIPAEYMVLGEQNQILIQFEKNKLWYRYTHTFSAADIKEAKKLSDSIISTFKFRK